VDSGTNIAGDVDHPSPGRNKLADDPETESGTRGGLGGEERLKEAGQVLLGYTDAGVLDGDEKAPVTAFIGPADRDLELPAVAHGIDGVRDEVGEDLMEFATKGVDGGNDGIAADDVDGGSAEAAFVDGKDFVDEGGDIDVGGDGGFAVEAEGVAGDVGDAVEFSLGGFEVLAVFGALGGRGAGEIDEVEDGFEGVVDLVGDGGGEAAGRGKFFGEEELFLLNAAVGEVLGKDGEAIGGWIGVDVDPAAEGLVEVLDAAGLAGFHRFAKGCAEGGFVEAGE
jgi:hypothetical protein